MNYKLNITRSKNAKCFYVQTSYRKKDGRVTTKNVMRLGNENHIKETYGVDDAEAWARAYVEELRRKEKEGEHGIMLELHADKRIGSADRLYNGGDIYIEKTASKLNLRNICAGISERHSFKFDLYDYLRRMVGCRILNPGSKLSDFLSGNRFLEHKELKLENFYRSLDVIGDEMNELQAGIYRNSLESIGRNTGVIYYDCTNVFFETETDDDFRKYGHSKENRPNPLVQIGMFMDMDGLPLAMCVNPGNLSEQQTLQPMEEVLANKFNLSKFVVCTDGGLGSKDNRKYNVTEDRNFITVQSLKKLSKHYQDWALDPTGWKLRPRLKDDADTRCLQTYCLNDIDFEKEDMVNDVFYKECLTSEKAYEEHLIITYSRKYDLYQKEIRARQIERAIVKINRGEINRPKSPNDCRRFMKPSYFDAKGKPVEVLTGAVLDMDQIDYESRFDGFNALATSLDDDPCTIIRVNSYRWEIEDCFRVEKSDLDMRPVYVRSPKRIAAHFFICFLSLLILKIMQKQFGGLIPIGQIRETLAAMNLTKIEGVGYIPSFNPTPVANMIMEHANIFIDKQINTPAAIRSAYRTARKS